MSHTFTSDFRVEFEQERERWLQRRFLWYSGILAGWNVLKALGSIGFLIFLGAYRSGGASESTRTITLVELAVTVLCAALFTGAFFHVRRHPMPRERVLRLVSALIVVVGSIAILLAPSMAGATVNIDDASRPAAFAGSLAGLVSILGIMMMHIVASLFIPWSAREAIRPLIPLLIIYAIRSIIFTSAPLWMRIVFVSLSPLIGVPGVAVAAWRSSRFKDQFTFRMLKGRYGEMRQDLGYARKIHESMFPQPLREGPVRFEYRYEPMRQIGGDYLFAKMTAAPGGGRFLNMAIVDVTGHGIGAALTVNRLHGEFERQYGESPGAGPGAILNGLNSYLHHTLALHSVYATAICVQFDPVAGTLRWASAGHPPAFLRSVDGKIDRLDSTTLVLGACRGDDFDPLEESKPFGPGDMLILYTDGAIEARNSKGRMLRVEGMQRLVASVRPDQDGGFASAVLRAVDEFRSGPPEDDTLVVEVWRPV